jgi:hypothetical protein
MQMLKVTLVAAAACALAATAIAEPVHLTDVQFLAANRCLGLMSSKGLGTPDAATLGRYVKAQSTGRIGYVYDRADQARDDAQREGDRDSAATDPRLIAERDGVCRGFVGAASTTAAAAPRSAHTM